ncbi:hypothetical protein DMB66_19450 [Actinoplanes sp. ATCC 53533]|uniref:hypothetical protein n=1 Tax=Actinoplanes sp. ATCC 53533 TaxID=1288362 RepID=UPI000F7856DA|nr:hypothetical protein [Actinoplanes sp. ATCC 53533]RSM64507.1 hypothetical protein DMB66_19450 [Actinoplanes sp. ATCC 53533]
MRIKIGTPAPTRRLRGLALVIATGATVGSVLVAAAPANANATTKRVAADGNSVTFTTSDSSRDVSGSVEFTIDRDGNWKIDADARNGNLVGRKVHWICDLTLGSSNLRKSTGTKKVPGKKTRSLDAAAYEPFIDASYDQLATAGQADCDIVIG